MSVLNLSSLVPTYQFYIDAIINEMGKPVTIFFEETISNVSSNFSDNIRDGTTRMPSYKSNNSLYAPTVVDNKKTIISLLKFNPQEYQRYGVYVNQESSILRLKTYLTDVPDLLRAKYIIPNYDDNANLGNQKRYRIVRSPIPVGLQKNRYSVSYWEQI